MPVKVTIDIDCTPLEARQFIGLPDVQPLQKAFLDEIERKMMTEMNNFSTEKLMGSWLSLAPQGGEWFKMMMDQFSTLSGAGKSSK